VENNFYNKLREVEVIYEGNKYNNSSYALLIFLTDSHV